MEIEEGGEHRITNACARIGRPIFLVGSRASGTAGPSSDFDYVIPGIRSREWQKIKNSLPGAKYFPDNLPNRIDLFKEDIDYSRPYIKFE
ncbi:nucleotidyltransferase domain-containing protein [Flavobacterium cerinum]|uniref:Nucleotidyltransferase domain-containing protein n=1 Tax=Flavobacterium cerinum TaxID=2502784 RepID=A0ABY5IMA1_9FLAO|nr:nucleotidyltransferase domain-containing protein [Flavobacterium cerinum]UUC43947.1 nucleotidyltransferase domain-containing protein [Flavobacterium cerinum]